jgi:hypothetical protein
VAPLPEVQGCRVLTLLKIIYVAQQHPRDGTSPAIGSLSVAQSPLLLPVALHTLNSAVSSLVLNECCRLSGTDSTGLLAL